MIVGIAFPSFIFIRNQAVQKLSLMDWTKILRLHSTANSCLAPQFLHKPFGLRFRQFGFYPHIIRFISPFSRGLTTVQLMGLPVCYFPL